MAKKAEQRSAEFRAGLFIIITLTLLIFSILWLRYFSVRPEMTIAARFTNPGPIGRGLQTFYQGVNIGKVSKIVFSQDFKYTLVYIDIYQKNLRLPANIVVQVRMEGITGQKYLDITYPSNPSSRILANGDIVRGKSPFGIEDIQDFFEQQVKSGRFERMLANTEKTLAYSYAMTAKLDKMAGTASNILEANKDEINNFLKQGSRAATDLSNVIANINDFVGDPNTTGDLRSTIRATSDAAQSIDKLINDKEIRKNFQGIVSSFNGFVELIGKAGTSLSGLESGTGAQTQVKGLFGNLNNLLTNINQLFKDVNDTCLIENASNAFSKAGATFDQAGGVLNKTGNYLNKSDGGQSTNISGLVVDTLQNTNKAAQRIDCTSAGISEMLSKRFLLIRLLFGKPGAALEDCDNLEEYNAKTQPEAKDKSAKPDKATRKPCPKSRPCPTETVPKKQPCPIQKEQLPAS